MSFSFSSTIWSFVSSSSASGIVSASMPGGSTTRCSTPTADARLPVPLPRPADRRHGRRARTRGSRGTTCTRRTGIQTMPINTVFQLLAERRTAPSLGGRRIALVPDLFWFWLTGELVNEATIASTTGLLDARSGRWAREHRLHSSAAGASVRDDPVEPGVTLGSVLRAHDVTAPPAAGVHVHVVAGHDTASAFVAAPVQGADAAILSSGTWSLLGIELEQPVLTDRACAYNLTQRARHRRHDPPAWRTSWACGSSRSACSQWERAGPTPRYDELVRLAAASDQRDVPLFDPDDESLLAPGRHAGSDRGDLPRERAVAAGRARGAGSRRSSSRWPASTGSCSSGWSGSPGVTFESCTSSAAARATALLCQLTADLTGQPCSPGRSRRRRSATCSSRRAPTGELAAGGAASSRAASPDRRPTSPDDSTCAETYERFLTSTGLHAERPRHAEQARVTWERADRDYDAPGASG